MSEQAPISNTKPNTDSSGIDLLRTIYCGSACLQNLWNHVPLIGANFVFFMAKTFEDIRFFFPPQCEHVPSEVEIS
jgi:hypothetical protein